MTKTNFNQKVKNKKTKYKHLDLNKRRRLSIYLEKGLSLRQAAYLLSLAPSTVSREVKRGRLASKTGFYSAGKAQRQTNLKRYLANQQHRRLYLGSPQEYLIRFYLRGYLSPEQIAGSTKLGFSKDTIYRYLHTLDTEQFQEIRPYLRHGGRHRPAGSKNRLKLAKRAGKRSIAARPESVKNRAEFGHWEGDTIVGKKRTTRLITLVERKSGYLLAAYIPNATKELFARHSIKLLRQIQVDGRLSLTLDNGSEMNDFNKIEKRSKALVYFADPYASYQRGSNENTNGLLRQFFPKGSDFRQIKPAQLAKAVALINNRPRKRHGFVSPAVVFKEYLKG